MILMKLNKQKGQISIELIIILAILIVAAIILGILLINSANKSIDTADNTGEQVDDAATGFIHDMNVYQNVNVIYLGHFDSLKR